MWDGGRWEEEKEENEETPVGRNCSGPFFNAQIGTSAVLFLVLVSIGLGNSYRGPRRVLRGSQHDHGSC